MEQEEGLQVGLVPGEEIPGEKCQNAGQRHKDNQENPSHRRGKIAGQFAFCQNEYGSHLFLPAVSFSGDVKA